MKNKRFFGFFGSLLLLLVFQTSFAQMGLRLNYAYSNPLEKMGSTIRQMHGVSLEFTYQLPKSPFSVGLDVGFANYGTRKVDDFTIVHEEQVQGTYDLTISNNVCHAFLTTRLDLTSVGFVQPYISARLGVQEYHTDYTLENPNVVHNDECPEPVDEGTVLKDVAMAAGVGFGVKVDLGQAFNMDLGSKRLYFNVEANYLAGGSVRYMSLDAPNNVTPSTTNTDMPGLAPGVTTLNHRYHTGNVYRSAIKMYDIRVGMGINF